MDKVTINRSPLVAGFMAAAMALHSPSGHDAFYQAALRVWFAPEWIRSGLSFQNFRDTAEFYVYHEDMDVFGHRLRLLKDPFSFCLPFTNGGENQSEAPQNFNACHAAAMREDKKGKGKKACKSRSVIL